MRVWIYRPDMLKPDHYVDHDLLYYKGMRASEWEKNKRDKPTIQAKKLVKPHYVEVPHER